MRPLRRQKFAFPACSRQGAAAPGAGAALGGAGRAAGPRRKERSRPLLRGGSSPAAAASAERFPGRNRRPNRTVGRLPFGLAASWGNNARRRLRPGSDRTGQEGWGLRSCRFERTAGRGRRFSACPVHGAPPWRRACSNGLSAAATDAAALMWPPETGLETKRCRATLHPNTRNAGGGQAQCIHPPAAMEHGRDQC